MPWEGYLRACASPERGLALLSCICTEACSYCVRAVLTHHLHRQCSECYASAGSTVLTVDCCTKFPSLEHTLQILVVCFTLRWAPGVMPQPHTQPPSLPLSPSPSTEGGLSRPPGERWDCVPVNRELAARWVTLGAVPCGTCHSPGSQRCPRNRLGSYSVMDQTVNMLGFVATWSLL